MRLKAEWAFDSEAIRARRIIIVLIKSSQLVEKILGQNILHLLKLDFNTFLQTKHYRYGRRFLPLVGYNI